ncbi:MAG: hypothetical protein C5B51_17455 [Terriglobia bacterium]|nr:MAG: hypothetical protein C5B51_17455 [Terriglobia bacterium]
MMRLAIMGVLLGLLYGQAGSQGTPLSTCELVSRRAELAGRIVTVRSEVKPGGHGPYLIAAPSCEYRLITRGVAWPNVVYLAYPDNKSRIESYHADFQVDWRSVARAEEEEKRQGFNPASDRIFKTFIGLLVTYSDLENRVTPEVPGAPKLGFGPVGLDAPAQLLIKSVGDVVVVRGN